MITRKQIKFIPALLLFFLVIALPNADPMLKRLRGRRASVVPAGTVVQPDASGGWSESKDSEAPTPASVPHGDSAWEDDDDEDDGAGVGYTPDINRPTWLPTKTPQAVRSRFNMTSLQTAPPEEEELVSQYTPLWLLCTEGLSARSLGGGVTNIKISGNIAAANTTDMTIGVIMSHCEETGEPACPKLRKLVLEDQVLLETPIISHFTLEELAISHSPHLTNEAVQTAAAGCQRLTHLTIADCPLVTFEGFGSLSLTHLTIRNLPSLTTDVVLRVINACPKLYTLDITGCRNVDKDVVNQYFLQTFYARQRKTAKSRSGTSEAYAQARNPNPPRRTRTPRRGILARLRKLKARNAKRASRSRRSAAGSH